MSSIYQSQAYIELMQAVRARDRVRQAQIIEEQLAATAGAEKAQWLLLRAARASDMLKTEQAPMWDLLEQALALAPDDPEVKEKVLGMALGHVVAREQFDRCFLIVRRLGLNRRELTSSAAVLRPMGFLHLRRRTWARAYYWWNRAIEYHWSLPKAEQVLRRGSLVFDYCNRCRSAACLHNLEQAEADLAVIRAMSAYYEPGYLDPLAFAMPEAEVALLKGDTREATMHLQRGMADIERYHRSSHPASRVVSELLAARIARAEGNMIAFHHFCQQALTICHAYNLPFTERGVRRVMAGAE